MIQEINQSFSDFIKSSGPSEYVQPDLVHQLFNSQSNFSKACKRYGRGAPSAVAAWLRQFLKDDKIDHEALGKELAENRTRIMRALGPDKLRYLELIVTMLEAMTPPKKGLLYANAAKYNQRDGTIKESVQGAGAGESNEQHAQHAIGR